MKLHSEILAFVLLLGVAHAKDKDRARFDDYPMTVNIVGTQSNPAADSNLSAWDCGMTLSDGERLYTVASNGFCRTMSVGSSFHARKYASHLGITIIELAWYNGDGKFKTAKYRLHYVTAIK